MGDIPFKALNVRLKLLLSEKPHRSTISPMPIWVPASIRFADAMRQDNKYSITDIPVAALNRWDKVDGLMLYCRESSLSVYSR